MFEEEILDLAERRGRVEELGAQVAHLRRGWEKEHEELLTDYADAAATAQAVESNLRELVVLHFERTGDKKPHPKLGIRERVKVIYCLNAATVYAKTNAQDLLTLDKRKLEKYAKALAGDSLVLGGALGELITFTKEPTATIAKSLED